LAILGICVLLVLVLKKDKIMLPFLFLMISIPSAQRIVLAEVDFSFSRIMILVMLVRVFTIDRNVRLNIVKTDILILFWAAWGVTAYTILVGAPSAFVTRAGHFLDVCGPYFLGRFYIRTVDDVRKVVVFLCIISIPTLAIFLVERLTTRNLFAELGGVPDFTLIREGRLRCQGPFAHPIMAGIFWGSVLPWLAAFWFANTKSKAFCLFFAVVIGLIVLNTASSTPVMMVLFVLMGIGLYVIRGKVIPLVWATFFGLVVLHFVMRTPVWHLISRIDISGGSTGWHRYFLIDQTIAFFHEWWLVGTVATAHWGHGLSDVTNQYILEGVRGGLLGMLIFIAVLWSMFNVLRKALKRTHDKEEYWFLWMAGVTLFAHLMGFLAVSYFGQTLGAFFLFCGVTVSIALSSGRKKRDRRKRQVEVADVESSGPKMSNMVRKP